MLHNADFNCPEFGVIEISFGYCSARRKQSHDSHCGSECLPARPEEQVGQA